MKKSDLVQRLSLRFPDLIGRDAHVSVKLIHDGIMQALFERKRVEIREFGVFEVHHRPPRNACNPKTGETYRVGDRYLPHFRPGKELRSRVEAAARLGAALP